MKSSSLDSLVTELLDGYLTRTVTLFPLEREHLVRKITNDVHLYLYDRVREEAEGMKGRRPISG